MTDSAVTVRVVRAAGRAGVPVLLWGTPGTGKSELVETLGRLDGLQVEVVIGSLREPADFAGLPVVHDDGTVVFAPPRWAQRLVESDGGYLFLDELSTASPSVQAAMLRVAKERVVGDVALPATTRIVAAANPVETAAGGWELEAPTANRFLHLTHEPDLELWSQGMTIGFEAVTGRLAGGGFDRLDRLPAETPVADPTAVTAQIVGFLRARPSRFNDPPRDPVAAGRGWPSPRSWHNLCRVLSELPESAAAARLAAATGLVGEASAVELLTWIQHTDLPAPDDVLDGRVAFNPHDREDRLFAILSGVAAVAVLRGDAQSWLAAWEVVRQVRVDVAAVPARTLFGARPADAAIPDGILDFEPTLRRAGLVGP